MAAPLIQTSFAAGELAPNLLGRVDLEKYRSGLAMSRNFFVDYRGGVSSRSGTQFVGFARQFTAKPRLIRFQFSSLQTYILVLNPDQTMNFVTNGAFITEGSFAITGGVPSGSSLVLTAPGHNYSVFDQVQVSGVVGLARSNGISGVNGRTLSVIAVSGNQVTLTDPMGIGLTIATWSAYASGGTVARIYEVAIPWLAADLFALNYTQSADVLTITHPAYTPQDINRYGEADWTITPVVIGAALSSPSSLTMTPQGSSAQASSPTIFNYAYAVTAVNSLGEESNANTVATGSNYGLNQNTGVLNALTWSTVAGASFYKIYKAQVLISGQSAPYFWGYIGSSYLNSFADTNIQADFTDVPPTNTNPFGTGPLLNPVVIDAAGYGYRSPVANISDATGSGGIISLGINAAGGISTASVSTAGSNYSAPRVTVSESDATLGTGASLAFSGAWTASGADFVPAAGSITLSALGSGYHILYATVKAVSNPISSGVVVVTTTNGVLATVEVLTAPVSSSNLDTLAFTLTDILPGTNGLASGAYVRVASSANAAPSVCAYFNQRKVYAATAVAPNTFFASRPGLYNNFDTSQPSQADDAITGTLVAEEVNAINSLTAMPSGLIALTSDGAYLISGGAPGAAFTPSQAIATTQAFSGAAPLPPLRINYDLLYVQSRGSAVRDLSYNFYVNVYTGVDISALSSHLLFGRQIVQWAYAEEPHYMAWMIRDDGILLSLTYLKEQEIYGWARHDTQGSFVSVEVIQESGEDVAYFAVQRYVNGKFVYFIERLASRFFGADSGLNIPSDPAQAWCVDAGSQYPLGTPQANLTFAPGTAEIGTLAAPQIITGGSGYAAPQVNIFDLTGTGAQIDLTVAAGVITGATLVSGGSGYTNPGFEIVDATGSGAVISAAVQTLLTFNADQPVFAATDVGFVLRAAGGVGTVTEFITNQQVQVSMSTMVAGLLVNVPGAVVMPPLAPGAWFLTKPQTVVGGLDHLTGSMVAILADGSVVTPQVVTDGCITLPEAADAIIAGHGFSCQLKTLRLDAGTPTIQGRRKTLPAVTIRAHDTRGLMVGRDFTNMTEVKERDIEQFGNPVGFQQRGAVASSPYPGMPQSQIPWEDVDHRIVMDGKWDEEGQLCVLQAYPLPATLLADIVEVTVGDDPDQ